MARNRGGARVSQDRDVFGVDIADESFVVISLPVGTMTAVPDGLTAAEQQVAHDAAAGLTNAEIGKKRGRSPRTIANQLASIYRKLGVASRAELAARLIAGR